MATTLLVPDCAPLIHAVEILLPYTTAEDRVSLYLVIYCTPELFSQSELNF